MHSSANSYNKIEACKEFFYMASMLKNSGGEYAKDNLG